MEQLAKRITSYTVEKVTVKEFGAPEVLTFEQESLRPNPNRGILIETWVIGIGYVDVMAQRGGYFLAPKRPFSPGYELVGRVIEAHESKQFRPGDVVAALLPTLGAYRTMLEIPESRLVKLPAGGDPLKSAAAILNYLTAYCILDKKAKVRSGETVLIHGASGGVGTALAQIGRLKGLNMYGTASAAKHDLLQSLDVYPIDYRSEDFVHVLQALHPEGIDAAFDAIGGKHLRRSARVVRKGGVVVSYGFSGNNYGGYLELIKGILNLVALNLQPNGKRVVGCGTPGESVKYPDWYRTTLADILQQVHEGILAPVIDRVFPFSRVREAHAYLESGQLKGKLLLTTEAYG